MISNAFQVDVETAIEKVGKDENDSELSTIKLALVELIIEETVPPKMVNVPKQTHSNRSGNKAKENESPDNIDEKLKAINDIANQSELISLPKLNQWSSRPVNRRQNPPDKRHGLRPRQIQARPCSFVTTINF